MAFVTPVVEQWLEWEIAQCDDPLHYEQMLYQGTTPCSISFSFTDRIDITSWGWPAGTKSGPLVHSLNGELCNLPTKGWQLSEFSLCSEVGKVSKYLRISWDPDNVFPFHTTLADSKYSFLMSCKKRKEIKQIQRYVMLVLLGLIFIYFTECECLKH